MYEKAESDLKSMIELLEKEGSRWSQLFQKALAAFEDSDYQRCAETILSGSGGMGSLNDLVLGQVTDTNGKFQWKPGHEEINNSYQVLLSALYAFAQGMRHTADKRVN